MSSTATVTRAFEKAPCLFVWVLGTVVWILGASLLVHVARGIVEWLRMWWYLRDVPKPKPQKSFTLLLDLYRQMYAMGPKVDVKVKAFRYLKGLFKSFEDQDVTVAYYGPYAILLGATPQVAEAILGNTKNVTKAFFYKMMKPWIGGGIIALDDEQWRVRRKMILQSFHVRILDDYGPIMDKRGKRLIRKLKNRSGQYFDFLPVLRAATFGVLFETTMGVDYNEDDAETVEYLKIHDAICQSILKRLTNFHHWFDCVYAFSKDYKEMSQYVEEAKDFVSNILQKRIADYRKGIRDSVSENSLLEVLLRMCVDKGTLSEIDVRDEMITMLIGGFDFTATGLAFALYLLGHHPDIQSKVRDEMDAAFGDDLEKSLDTEAIKGLTYTECVLKRHPRYIKDPDCFIPERFMGVKSMPTYAYAPFSAGPRNCIGQRFALREEKILLTHILRRYNVSSKVPIDKLELAIDMVLKPVQDVCGTTQLVLIRNLGEPSSRVNNTPTSLEGYKD
ncbi:hypothetical protein MTO96_031251 [Rhipicephalus appendiculatus]